PTASIAGQGLVPCHNGYIERLAGKPPPQRRRPRVDVGIGRAPKRDSTHRAWLGSPYIRSYSVALACGSWTLGFRRALRRQAWLQSPGTDLAVRANPDNEVMAGPDPQRGQ